MTHPITVLVHGALGRMGNEVITALCHDPELKPVAAVDLRAQSEYLTLPQGLGQIPLSTTLEGALTNDIPNVAVDFTTAEAVMPMARLAAKNHINLVIGTTGLTTADLEEIEDLCQSYEVGAVVAPNFSQGAAIALHLAKVAAKYFDFAEIIELHHEGKADAPSGTAIATAKEMVAAKGRDFSHSPSLRESLKGSRGAELGGVALHSIRLPGLMAHQEVILGAQGETLRLRHDTINRGCYMPGVILAIKEVVKIKGMISGLDKLLGL